MIMFDTHPPSVGLILDADELELVQRLIRAYRLQPAKADIPLLDRLAERLS